MNKRQKKKFIRKGYCKGYHRGYVRIIISFSKRFEIVCRKFTRLAYNVEEKETALRLLALKDKEEIGI